MKELVEVKKEIEGQIILWDGILGIGIVNNGIEIVVERGNGEIKEKLSKYLANPEWRRLNIEIIETENFERH